MAVEVTVFPDTMATSYASIAELKSWAEQRLKDLGTNTDDQLGASLNAASEYIDLRFRFIGYRVAAQQAREWPRQNAWDDRGDKVDGIPSEIKDAVCAYAFLTLGGIELMPTPDYNSTGRDIKSKSEQVGPIKESVEYVETSGFRLPTFPAIDRLMFRRGLVCRPASIASGTLGRS